MSDTEFMRSYLRTQEVDLNDVISCVYEKGSAAVLSELLDDIEIRILVLYILKEMPKIHDFPIAKLMSLNEKSLSNQETSFLNEIKNNYNYYSSL